MSPFQREHDWPEDVDPPVPYPVDCETCGFTLGSGQDPLPLCPGDPEEQSTLDPSGPLPAVSDDKEQRRESSVTGEKLVMGEICDRLRREECLIRGRHECQFYPPNRMEIEPCHVRSRGAGWKDWRVLDDGNIISNVVPLCPLGHDLLDGDIGGGGRQWFEERFEIDLIEQGRKIARAFRGSIPEHVKMEAVDEII